LLTVAFLCLQTQPKDRSVRLRVMPEQSNDYRVVVFGAGGVGKSSLVLRFVRGTFRESYIPTIEDTYRQVISCNKQVCTLQITDTTGSHQFPAMQRLSISKGHAFILVYSITSRQSLEELKPIIEEIHEIKGSDIEGIPIMLVGNKCDELCREVSTSDGATIAKGWKCGHLETSAKTNYNVKELFQELLQLEKRRTMSLQLETKKTRSQKRKEKLKGKCSIMWSRSVLVFWRLFICRYGAYSAISALYCAVFYYTRVQFLIKTALYVLYGRQIRDLVHLPTSNNQPDIYSLLWLERSAVFVDLDANVDTSVSLIYLRPVQTLRWFLRHRIGHIWWTMTFCVEYGYEQRFQMY